MSIHTPAARAAADPRYGPGGSRPHRSEADLNPDDGAGDIPWAYFGLVLVISIPFWVLGAVSSARLTPSLSLGSLMIVAPFAAAVILAAREGGPGAVGGLLRRAVDVRGLRPRAWYVPIFLLMPALMALEFAVMRLAGASLPDPVVTVVDVVAGLGLYFVAAVLEEVGWSGYAIDRLQARRSALAAGVILGAVWGAWHLVAILEMPAYHAPAWVALQVANQVLCRVVIVWIYNNTGRSVLAAVLFHAVMNVSELVLFPVNGSHYDPLVADGLLVLVVVAIVLGWGSQTLAAGPRLGSGRLTGGRPGEAGHTGADA